MDDQKPAPANERGEIVPSAGEVACAEAIAKEAGASRRNCPDWDKVFPVLTEIIARRTRVQIDGHWLTAEQVKERLLQESETAERDLAKAGQPIEAATRLRHAEDLLTSLSNGYWVAVLDDAADEQRMGQRVLDYWRDCEARSLRTWNSATNAPEVR